MDGWVTCIYVCMGYVYKCMNDMYGLMGMYVCMYVWVYELMGMYVCMYGCMDGWVNRLRA